MNYLVTSKVLKKFNSSPKASKCTLRRPYKLSNKIWYMIGYTYKTNKTELTLSPKKDSNILKVIQNKDNSIQEKLITVNTEIEKQKNKLQKKLKKFLKEQGFTIKAKNELILNEETKEKYRELQQKSKIEQIEKHQIFLSKTTHLAQEFMVNGNELRPDLIDLELRLVRPNSLEEKLFKWWNFVWWSIPYQQPYGRQMRFIIWDRGNNAPFGLISLQSPILKQAVRDKYLSIPVKELDYWVNRSMYAQRVGALPPYNYLLGGKLVALSLVSNEIRNAYREKYQGNLTLLQNREIDSDLLFISTTSAFGKSSIYNRLKFNEQQIAEKIGYTQGYGSFQISDELYKDLIEYLTAIGENVSRSYGDGPSRKMKLIRLACKKLGLANYTYHGIKREYYIFPFTRNVRQVISGEEEADWLNLNFNQIVKFWSERWLENRIERNQEWRRFSSKNFLNNILSILNIEKNTNQNLK